MEDNIRHMKRGLQKAKRMNFILMVCVLLVSLILLIYVTNS